MPHARQMWYCVCDIKLPVAEEILKTDITQVMPKYDTASGWLPAGIIETLREAIKSDVAATMSSMRESEEISMEVQEENEDEQAEEDIFISFFKLVFVQNLLLFQMFIDIKLD